MVSPGSLDVVGCSQPERCSGGCEPLGRGRLGLEEELPCLRGRSRSAWGSALRRVVSQWRVLGSASPGSAGGIVDSVWYRLPDQEEERHEAFMQVEEA